MSDVPPYTMNKSGAAITGGGRLLACLTQVSTLPLVCCRANSMCEGGRGQRTLVALGIARNCMSEECILGRWP